MDPAKTTYDESYQHLKYTVPADWKKKIYKILLYLNYKIFFSYSASKKLSLYYVTKFNFRSGTAST